MSSTFRAIGLIGVIVATFVTGTAAATAATVNYATASAPQKISGYGSWVHTYGKWDTAKKTNSVTSRLTGTHYKLHDADNHTAYVWFSTSVVTGITWYDGETLRTSHDNKTVSSWSKFRTLPSTTLDVQKGSNKIDAQIRTCIDIPLRVDPCSSYKSLASYFSF